MIDILFALVFVVILVVILIFLIFLYILKITNISNISDIKGTIGESRVASQLNKLPDDQYKVFNDILIRTSKGTSQIDHIVISIYGIFVIETKNYRGWIHGNENSEYWTQSSYNYKTKFRNPIKQNWAHIYALKEVLSKYKQIIYHPIIVFAGTAELKNIDSKIPVIYVHELFKIIMDEQKTKNLSIEQMKNIVDKLNEFTVHDKEAKHIHINQVQHYVHERERKEKLLICPNCGGNLVVRNGQYGKFYGCSNYPKCKYTLSI